VDSTRTVCLGCGCISLPASATSLALNSRQSPAYENSSTCSFSSIPVRSAQQEPALCSISPGLYLPAEQPYWNICGAYFTQSQAMIGCSCCSPYRVGVSATSPVSSAAALMRTTRPDLDHCCPRCAILHSCARCTCWNASMFNSRLYSMPKRSQAPTVQFWALRQLDLVYDKRFSLR
jgi:hypothetical protein